MLGRPKKLNGNVSEQLVSQIEEKKTKKLILSVIGGVAGKRFSGEI